MPKSPRQTTGARLNIVRRDGIFISGDAVCHHAWQRHRSIWTATRTDFMYNISWHYRRFGKI